MRWMTAVAPACLLLAGTAPRAAPTEAPRGFDERAVRYCPAADAARARDALRLDDGTLRAGKALEWGTDVLVFDAAGHVETLAAERVTRIDFPPDDAPAGKHGRPAKPDLTVACVRRVAADSAAGGARFVVTARNVGGLLATNFAYRVWIDGREVATGRCAKNLVVDQDFTIEVAAGAATAPRELRAELDTDREIDELCEGNNVLVEPLGAMPVEVIFSRADAERLNRSRNMIDSYSAEDWAQHQVRCLNRLLQQSIWPSSPGGAALRLRIDCISTEPAGGAAPGATADRGAASDAGGANDRSAPGATNDAPHAAAGHAARLVWRVQSASQNQAPSARGVDWSGLKQLCLQLGLPDLAGYDMRPRQCLVRDAADRFVQIGHHLPGSRLLTYRPGPFPLSESDVAFLNESLGAPGTAGGAGAAIGDARYRFPRRCLLEVRDNIGRPVDGVRMEIFQRLAEGEQKGCIPPEPIILGSTEGGGRLPLPNRPAADAVDAPPPAAQSGDGDQAGADGAGGISDNPWGRIDGQGLSALFLVRLSWQSGEEYHFVRALDFQTAFARGQRDEFALPLLTHFSSGGPDPNDYTRLYFEDFLKPGQVEFRWPHWGKSGAAPVREYRVYQRTGQGGDQDRAWRLVDVVKPNPPAPPPHPHRCVRDYYAPLHSDGTDARDTWFAMAGVTPAGQEGRLSYPLYLPDVPETLRCAMDAARIFYIPVGRSETTPLLACDLMRAGFPLRPFGLRVTRPEFAGYEPAAHGAAVAGDGRLILADAVNHQIAWYERGELVKLVGGAAHDASAAGSGPAEFNQPSDVAVDERGRIYVADRMNHRVVILSADGAPLGVLDGEGEGPPPPPPPAVKRGGGKGKRRRAAEAAASAAAATTGATSAGRADAPNAGGADAPSSTGAGRSAERAAEAAGAPPADGQVERAPVGTEAGSEPAEKAAAPGVPAATQPQPRGDHHFDQPLAVACLGGFLTVTDVGAKRVSVFDIASAEKPRCVRAIGGLSDPDRAMVSPTRRLYVCDRGADGKWSVLVYPEQGDQPERVVQTTMQGFLNRPRGLCYDGRKFAYLINQFPFRVSSLQLE